MANTITWEVYAGSTPDWKDASGTRLGFGGWPKNIYGPLVVGEWQRGTHLGTSDPGIDACGKNHIPNTRFVSTTTWDGGGREEPTNETAMAITECTLRIHVGRTYAQGIKGARVFVYDGMNTKTRAEGIKVYAFQRGASGRNYWTLINDGDAGIGGDNPGEYLALDDSAPATDHYFYVALSIQLQRYDVLPTFNIGFEFGTLYVESRIAASDDDAVERLDTHAVDLTNAIEYINYLTSTAYSDVGLRFRSIYIPKTTTITEAHIALVCKTANSVALTTNIYGEDNSAPAAFTTAGSDVSARTKTTATASWTPGAWVADTAYNTADLKAIVEEITSRADWSPGNNLAMLFISDEATAVARRAKSYDDSPTEAPLLHVEWAPSTTYQSHVQGLLNFCTGDPEYEIWVLDKAQQRRFPIDEIPAGFHWEKAEQGWSSFNDFKVNINSPAYAWLRAFERILIRRGRHDLFVALNEKPTSELPENSEDAATYTALGRSLNALLERRRCVPLDGDDYLQYTGHPDDAAKYMVQYNMVQTYAERPGDAGRAEAGFSVQPARGECPEDAVVANRTYKYNHEATVGDACADLASRYGLDYEVKCDGEGRLDFETYYPWRGVNRAEGNPEGNRQVVLTVNRENLTGLSAYKDCLKIFNVIYVLGAGQGANRLVIICKNQTSIDMYGRREGVLSMGSTSDEAVLTQKGQTMLAINGYPVEGVTFKFRQTEALKYGRDFDVGDYVSLYFAPFQVNLQDNWKIKRVTGTLMARGENPGEIVEELEITLGKDELDLASDDPGGGGSGTGPIISLEPPTTIQPDDEPFAGDPEAEHFNELTSILHVHGIVTDAPYDTGGRTTNVKDQYGADNPGNADMSFVRRSHQHAIFDSTTPEVIGSSGSSRVNATDNHAAYRSHAHACARYSHTHDVAGDTSSNGAHTHAVSSSADGAGAHTHAASTLISSGGGHTHDLSSSHRHNISHCHSYSGATDVAAGHTHAFSWTLDSSGMYSSYVETLTTASGGAHTHDAETGVGSAGTHTHTISSSATSAGAHTHSADGSLVTGVPA
jgi:hypothetical protein